jgi:hypothetical protein
MATARRSHIVAISIVSIAGCRDLPDSSTRSPVAPVDSPRRTSIALKPTKIRSEERVFADLAAAAPSSAGFYFDKSGGMVIFLANPAEAGAVRGAMAAMLAAGRIAARNGSAPPISIKNAQYSFNELAAWRDIVFENVFTSTAGLTTLDLDEANNRVTIGVDPVYLAQLRAALPARLSALGVDTNAVRWIENGIASAVAKDRRGAAFHPSTIALTSNLDTLVGGVTVATLGGGSSLGVVLNYGGTASILTCSHRTQNKFFFNGDTLFHYGAAAVESADPSGYSCGLHTCRESDAAMERLLSGVPSLQGLIARTTYSHGPGGSGSLTWDSTSPYFAITGVATALSYGDPVNKVGATTGWTTGNVTDTCVDVNVGSTTTCMYEADMYIDHGDSGSPVFTLGPGDAASFVGIVSARKDDFSRSYFSPIWRIQTNLPSSMTITRGVNLSTPSGTSGSVSGGNPVITWNAVSGATRYYLYTTWVEWLYDEYGSLYSVQHTMDEVTTPVTGTSYTDVSVTVQSYTTGTSNRVYFVVAASDKDVSGLSAGVYFIPLDP